MLFTSFPFDLREAVSIRSDNIGASLHALALNNLELEVCNNRTSLITLSQLSLASAARLARLLACSLGRRPAWHSKQLSHTPFDDNSHDIEDNGSMSMNSNNFLYPMLYPFQKSSISPIFFIFFFAMRRPYYQTFSELP